MRRPQIDKKGRAVSWTFSEVGEDGGGAPAPSAVPPGRYLRLPARGGMSPLPLTPVPTCRRT